MKFLATWSVRPGCVQEAASRFLAGKATVPHGAKLLGRWHKADGSGGVSLVETDNPSLLYENAAEWMDVLEIQSHAVVEDAEAGPILAKVFGK
jgi:Protein of unknown function (DUF3303)